MEGEPDSAAGLEDSGDFGERGGDFHIGQGDAREHEIKGGGAERELLAGGLRERGGGRSS